MAALFWDVDRDGDLDLSVINSSGSRLYLNPADDNEFLTVKVEPAPGNAFGAGSVVELYPRGQAGVAGALLGRREINPSGGAGDQLEAHFGADSARLYDVLLRLPGGREIVSTDVPAGGELRVTVQ